MFRLNDPAADAGAQYEAGLRLIEAAEQVGLDSVWITSHHFNSDKGTIPSPLLFLAAASQRTRKIRLGAAVVVLTLEDPIRVAEDAAIADLIAKGRLNLGLGSGLEDWAFDAFGIDWEKRHEIFDGKLKTLKRILAGETLARERRLHPPASGLLRKIWRVGTEINDIIRIAEDGDNLLLGASKKRTLTENRKVQAEAIAKFRRRSRPDQRIATSRYLFAHPDGDEARRIFGQAPASPVKKVPGALPDSLRYEEAAIIGSPAEIRAALEADRQIPLLDDLFIQAFPAKLTLDQWTSSLKLLSTEVFVRSSPLRQTRIPRAGEQEPFNPSDKLLAVSHS